MQDEVKNKCYSLPNWGMSLTAPVPKKVPKYEVNHMMEMCNKRTRCTGVYKSQHSMSTRMCCNQYNVNNNMNCNKSIVTDLSAGKIDTEVKDIRNKLNVKPKVTSQNKEGNKRKKLNKNFHEQSVCLAHFTAKPFIKIQEEFFHGSTLR